MLQLNIKIKLDVKDDVKKQNLMTEQEERQQG